MPKGEIVSAVFFGVGNLWKNGIFCIYYFMEIIYWAESSKKEVRSSRIL
jgi:hypothetical protein